MKVISKNKEVLNSYVSVQTIDGVFGLVLESRGGAKGKRNERNTDYLIALDTLLYRLQKDSIETIRIHIASSRAIKVWDPLNRIIEIDGKKDINLNGVDLIELRGKISKAQQDKKEDSRSKGGNPTKRILIEANINNNDWERIVLGPDIRYIPATESNIEDEIIEFIPGNAEKAKEMVSRSVASRRGQQKFRNMLLSVYSNSCAVTGTSFPPILEAAHIVPYRGEYTNHTTNGILLRADIHTLFDLGLLGINTQYEVITDSSLKSTEYDAYNGKTIRLPQNKSEYPNLAALKSRPLPRRH
ncbi:MAG: HNH endonuclease [Candidatus Thiodiazotropha taylori]|nr:HNH endonuclease [Candidatus Thiodiazotropha taylori]